ncbi:MAG: VOC family protein [Nitrosomonas sp.]|uniref:VOC family protein n=1 Tax=Nitrosomonas sp. JL21 TaxID=153949 RepID=UPI00196094DB|nr:VOC family protein [Nitrosomonas sp. JL21]MBL8497914.1 VOC family protein [Nitrosomonas sp.]MCC7091762.1 VOC family protein [Nitrosomonas sp.]
MPVQTHCGERYFRNAGEDKTDVGHYSSWFDDQAEEAAEFYTAIFSNSTIKKVTYYGYAGFEFHGRPAGLVMTVEFEMAKLSRRIDICSNEAISVQVPCKTQ